MKPGSVEARVAGALQVEVTRSVALSGGQVGSALRCALADGRDVVAKTSPGTSLEVEAYMLRTLRERSSLPVPEVVFASDELLVQSFVEGSSRIDDGAERDAGRLLADLHDVHSDRFGLERDTLLGPFALDNTWSESWPRFYAERRLRPLAAEAARRGELPAGDRRRVERLAAGLPDRFDAEPTPSLIHGDVWSGNVLARGGRVTAFLDPAIYYADAEVELAYIELFHTFGRPFYRAYTARRTIDAGYLRWRRALYQLVPLLVHVGLFGGAYLGGLRARLSALEA